jgi:Fe-coproporphyrin III synthase
MLISPRLKLHHSPRPRQTRRIPCSHLVKGAFFTLGLPRNAFFAIDVTARCNLHCRHCYFLEQRHDPKQELSVEAWLALLQQKKHAGWPHPYVAYQCNWVGGEPLLRREVIEGGRHFFPYNIVVTNGTIPLPAWPDVHFFISVDGTREAHEAIRGPGIYDRIKGNAARPELDVMITCCINRLNVHCLEEFLVEWDATPVRHVVFEFHTPIRGLAADEELALAPTERDAVLSLLLQLKEVYGSFILPPTRTYRLMHSSTARQVTERCLYRQHAVTLGPDGQPVTPCMLGPKADCDRCGCIVPFVARAQVDRRAIIDDVWHDLKQRLNR